jgi:hypothetical protein
MICAGALVAARVRVHDTDHGRVLRAHAYMDLQWTPDAPLEVRLSGCGQVTGDEVFARDLLAAALHDGSAGIGRVRFQLAVPAPHYVPKLLVTFDPGDPGSRVYALKPDPVQVFLRQTYDIIPAGEEQDYLPVSDAITALLRAA